MHTDSAYPPSVSLAILALLFLASLMLAAPEAFAASLESLVMPGPVAAGHADLEETCSNCHDAFDRDSQQQLCLDCHEPVAADLLAGEGFHGRKPEVGEGECSQCHSEHLGRDADISGLVVDLFDHNVTDFPLTGAHTLAVCSSCHNDINVNSTARTTATGEVPSIGYRLADISCGGCHESDDAHDGGLGNDCGSCHDSQSWSDGEYDHDQTEFPLTGQHAEVRCAGCHADNIFADTATKCIDCHRQDDVHSGSRGEMCSDCHRPQNWQAQFDHGTVTGFALEGVHDQLACAGCHVNPPGPGGAQLPSDCQGCHASDDVHLGRNGAQCSDCHSQSNWQVAFDHAAETGFQLEGSHQLLSCSSCHTGALEDPLPGDCWGCHELDDPHGATLLECDDCHGQSKFTSDLSFHHDLARFALVGLHRTVSCEQCHDSLVFSPEETGCDHCHQELDAHNGSLGNQCGSCHNPVGWDFWKFDHAATGFELTGAHDDLSCESCHDADQPKASIASNCQSCHRSDDVHHGGFGTRCDTCHGTGTFAEPVVGGRR
jgi:hypothetical protein